MRNLASSACVALVFLSTSAAASLLETRKSDEQLKPCTAKSSASGNYFDINPLHISADKKSKSKVESWHSRGHDYGANFTLNFCGGVVEDLEDLGKVADIHTSQHKNISAFYQKGNTIYSIGRESHEPVVRGRKLVLTYTHGSYCPPPTDRRRRRSAHGDVGPGLKERARKGDDDDDDDDDDRGRRPGKGGKESSRRKSTVISLLCERSPKDGDPPVTVSFVEAVDDCSYFFEARTPAACPTADSPRGGLGPGGVFGVIALITILVYLIGGIMYQRIVQHQRGWRQIPNYTLWSSTFGFLSDMFVILISSCSRLPGIGRFFGHGKGYSRLSLNGDSAGASRRGRADSDDENRLIDQLDETWED